MSKYVTKDSGKHEQYPNGMKRDTQEGKPRFDLMIPKEIPYNEQLLTRFASLLARGAKKYGDRNWEAGFSPEALERAESSTFRHFMQWLCEEGDGEDHAAAVLFGIMQVEYLRYMAPWQEAERVLKEARFGELHAPKMKAVHGQVRNNHAIQSGDKQAVRDRIAELKAKRAERAARPAVKEEVKQPEQAVPTAPKALAYTELVAMPSGSLVVVNTILDEQKLFMKTRPGEPITEVWSQIDGNERYTSIGLFARYGGFIRKLNA